MEEKKKFSGKTVNEAITNACTSLGVPSKRLEYNVIQQPSNGFLGIGSRAAIIEAWIRTEKAQPAPFAAEKPAEIVDKKLPVREAEDNNTNAENENKPDPRPAAPAASEKAAADTAAPAAQVEAGETEVEHFVSADEIEKRAAAAPAYDESLSAAAEKSDYSGRRGRSRYGKSDRRGRNGGRPERRRTHEFQAAPAPADAERPAASKPKPERKVKTRTEEEIKVLCDTAETFLNDVLSNMGTECRIETAYDPKTGTVSCVMSGSDMGILIGKRGQTLDSLQYLTSMAVNKKTDEYVRVKLDTEDYRERREETLRNLARSIAYKVRNTGEAFALEPMNPYERRIIHSSLQGNRYVETYSEGEEPHRHVIIAPKRR